MKLYLVTHFIVPQKETEASKELIKTTHVVAESMEIVARFYDCQKIELIANKVMVCKTPEDLRNDEP